MITAISVQTIASASPATPTDWVSLVVAGATFFLAVATGLLAWYTRKAVEESRKAVAAANETATAAIREAEATEALSTEARTDRELSWRPYLVIQPSTVRTGPNESWYDTVTIANIGPGPAIDCGYYAFRQGAWGQFSTFSLAAGADYKVKDMLCTVDGDRTFPSGMFDTPGQRPGLSRKETVRIIVCKDILGHRWRFFEGHVAEHVRRDDPEPPQWILGAPW